MTQELDALAGDVLLCPSCGGKELTLAEDRLECRGCGVHFPAQNEIGFAAMLPPSVADSVAKQNIQKWWGDLYEQLYAETDRDLTPDKLIELTDAFEDLMHARRHLVVTELQLRELDGKHLLEIGPGGGGHSCLFKKYGARVAVADITPERALSTARKLSLMEGPDSAAFNADGEYLPFRDDSFDIVYSNGVLHHAEDTDKCISEVFRILKPGGRAVIMLYSRHSAIYWLNILPRAIVTREIFRWSEPEWIGRLTEGRPKYGTTKNPFTRVYSRKEMQRAFASFNILSLRKSSFQFDNFALPKLSQIRYKLFEIFGYKPHPGGVLVYGAPYMPETGLELRLGAIAGFAWNIVAEKPMETAARA